MALFVRSALVALVLAVLALARGGRAAADWVDDLARGDPWERRAAALALADAAGADVAPALRRLVRSLDDPDEAVRAAARASVAVLAPREPDVLVDGLRLQGEGSRTLRDACRALLEELGPGAHASLARVLADPDDRAWSAARAVLGRAGEAARPAVEPLLEHPDARVRDAAAAVLGGS